MSSLPNADAALPNPAVRLDDRALMACGIPAFGIAIPFLTGLYGPLTPDRPTFWLGFLIFIALAAAIWLGNRWLLFRQREQWNWFGQPLRKLVMLVSANVLYTAPLTALVLWIWFGLARLPVDIDALKLVIATNVICVLFVTHAYETMFLIRERESDMLQVERLQRARAQAELAALKAQVDPHFLFNSLNALGHLIGSDAARAREFNETLAEVYRYLLAARDLVPLAEELAFVASYHRLLVLRFGESAIRLVLDPALAGQTGLVPPTALQALLENAVKHNEASAALPLAITVQLDGDSIRVANPLQPRRSALPSSGLGLMNLDERLRLLSGRGLERREGNGHFEILIPLLLKP